MSEYLATLNERVLIFDGAMGTSLQALELTADDFGGTRLDGCNEALLLSRPDVIAGVHRDFLGVGADVVETDTFGGSRPKLEEYGLGDRTYEINRRAAEIARTEADREAARRGRPCFVAGSIGPTGFLPSTTDPSLSNVTFEQLVAIFEEQARPLIDGGVDVVLIETAQDILEVRAALVGIRRCFANGARRVPIQAQVSLDTSGRMLLGTDMAAALTILEHAGADVVGLNCSTGPEHMRVPVRTLADLARAPLSIVPNAGIPINQNGRAIYPLEPEPMAEQLRQFVVESGVAAVGGCCGSTPDHIAAIRRAVAESTPKRIVVDYAPRVASAMRAQDLLQQPPPLLIGERVNTQGSRKVKRLLLADDYDGILEVAREQVEGGAHVLDVCVALTERSDEAFQMAEVVKRLRAGVDAPLVIDSTEPDVVRAALEANPGRSIVNSINLEAGREKADFVLGLVKTHGAGVVALTIDEQGMAHTAERKLEIARRIHDIAVGEHGLRPEDLIFDVLTFPVTTGQDELVRDAAETIEGIRRIKAALPGVLTSLGVSNVSFGVSPAARGVLNSVFLHHCVAAGLDMAIVNPSHITPYGEIPADAREITEDLIYYRRPDALPRFIARFEGVQIDAAAGNGADADADLPVAQRIHNRILFRKKEGIEGLLDEAMESRTPVEVLNDILLPAMKDVGDRFGAGELILPFVLQSAEVMKRAVRHLEQFLEKKDGYTKGKVVVATVYGDVHDIGKSLVNTILSNNGYTVFDLGKQVPVSTIVEKAQEVQADAIGLSALLVSTSKQMPLCIQELHARGLSVPVMIGGAAINRAFGRRVGLLPDGTPYPGGVFYCKDAFEGLDVMDQLTDPSRRSDALARTLAETAAFKERETPRAAAAASVGRSDVAPTSPPRAPFRGARHIEIPLADVWPRLDLNTLFRLHWGLRKIDEQERQRLIDEQFMPLLEELKAEAEREGWLRGIGLYGFFPAVSDGDTLVVLDPNDPKHEDEIARFTFPRQPSGERLCLADYFQPIGGRPDLVALQAVTVGPQAERVYETLEREGEYSRGLFIRGLASSTAEALADVVNGRIRDDLGLAGERGRRYSWGYGACPDLSQQRDVLRLLGAEKVGLALTAGDQLDPEHSTLALVVHHPEAKYFAVFQADRHALDSNMAVAR
ncbi:MAG: methionine synthase [Chloroflexi bacterium]|nr:methionine synthase [Chloroflexota bacterium]